MDSTAYQAPLSVGFLRQEHWNGLPCPPPGGLLDPEIKPMSPPFPALGGRFFTPSATWEGQIHQITFSQFYIKPILGTCLQYHRKWKFLVLLCLFILYGNLYIWQFYYTPFLLPFELISFGFSVQEQWKTIKYELEGWTTTESNSIHVSCNFSQFPMGSKPTIWKSLIEEFYSFQKAFEIRRMLREGHQSLEPREIFLHPHAYTSSILAHNEYRFLNGPRPQFPPL